jgi:hypothetical protein
LIYPYQTLIEELDELKNRRVAILQGLNSSNESEVYEVIETIDDYIDQTECAIKLLEQKVFV